MSNQNHPTASHEMHAMPVNFTAHLHKHGGSSLFLTGIILFSAGSVFASVFALGVFSVFALAFTALPITGFWLIYAASKTPKMPEKTLPALTLFKIHTIAGMVLIGLAVAAMLALSVIMIVYGALNRHATGWVGFNAGLSFILGIFFLVASMIIAGIFVLSITFYHVPILKILKGIRHNIIHNTFDRIRGVLPFTVTISIFVFFSTMLTFAGLANAEAFRGEIIRLLHLFMFDIPEIIPVGNIIITNISLSNFAMSYIFNLVSLSGAVICVVVLNRFARSMPCR